MSVPFGFGIEEEYFLVDAQTNEVSRRMPPGFIDDAKAALGDRVTGEFLQSQIEVITPPLTEIGAGAAMLRELRLTLAEIAAHHGLAIFAAGTHPTASWRRAQQSEGARYDTVMDDLQMIGQRNMLCGMHVHVELPDPARRVEVMARMLVYLPLFIALSASSPFWHSQSTGLKGYRLAAYDELPRTGIPDLFRTTEEYDSYIDALVAAGIIKDSSYIWWTIRPSLRHPTLELRAADCCTNLRDTIAIAALYRVLAHRLYRDPALNADHDRISRAITVENKWRAQRYGVHGSFADIKGGGAVPVAQMMDDVIADTREDADALDCKAEVEHCRTIVREGSSADRQIAIFEKQADNPEAALGTVNAWIAQETLR